VPLQTPKIVADALTKSLRFPAFVGHRQILTGHVPLLLAHSIAWEARALPLYFFILSLLFFPSIMSTHTNFLGLLIICLLKIPFVQGGQRYPQTMSAAVRQWPESAYE